MFLYVCVCVEGVYVCRYCMLSRITEIAGLHSVQGIT